MDPQLKTLLYIVGAVLSGAAGALIPGTGPELDKLRAGLMGLAGYCVGVVLQRRPADEELAEKARKYDAIEKLRIVSMASARDRRDRGQD